MRFVLTGTYNSCNKGDAAMELAATQGIVSRYPDSEVTILSPFPELDRPFYAPIPVERCNRRRLIIATVDLIRAMVWRWFSIFSGHHKGVGFIGDGRPCYNRNNSTSSPF